MRKAEDLARIVAKAAAVFEDGQMDALSDIRDLALQETALDATPAVGLAGKEQPEAQRTSKEKATATIHVSPPGSFQMTCATVITSETVAAAVGDLRQELQARAARLAEAETEVQASTEQVRSTQDELSQV